MKVRHSLNVPARLLTFLISGSVVLAITIAPTASAATLLDQQASFKGDGSNWGFNSSISKAQVFTPGISGTLTKVALGLGIDTNVTVTNFTIGIYSAASGVPTGSALASTTVTDFTGMSAGQAMFDVDFATPTAVTAGTTYAIVATTTDSFSSGSGWFMWFLASDYIGGYAATNTGSGWNLEPTYPAFTFATYVSTPSSSSSSVPATGPAPVLQQIGKPAIGTCDEAQAEGHNLAGVSSGGWAVSWAQWVNNGNGGAVCTRTLVYSTAQSKWAVS